MMTQHAYSVAQLAKRWEVGTDTIYAMIHAGRLRTFQFGGKLYRITAAEVDRFESQPALTRSSDSDKYSQWSGATMQDRTDIRLERLIERAPKRPRDRS